MATNLNLADLTYRSSLWSPPEGPTVPVQSSWKQRYKPARRSENKPPHHNHASQHPTSFHTNTTHHKTTAYQHTSTHPQTYNDGSSGSDVRRRHDPKYRQYSVDDSGWPLGSGNGDVCTSGGLGAVYTGTSRAESAGSGGDWGREAEGDWEWVQNEGCDLEMEMDTLRQGGAQKAVSPVQYFDRFNWQEKVRQIYLQHDAFNNDLHVRRVRRATRVRPWKRHGHGDNLNLDITEMRPDRFGGQDLLASGLARSVTIHEPLTQRRTSPWSSNTPATAIVTRHTPRSRITPSTAPVTNTNTPVDLRTSHTPGACHTPGKLDKPFGPKSEEWLRENEFSIWVKNKGSRPLDRSKYIVREKSANDGETPPDKQYDHIGPHKDVFAQCNQDKMLMDEQQRAILVLQKFLRGYIQRHRFRRLRDRVILKHAGTFKRFVREYKGLLTRIQKRHNVNKPKTPFNLNDVNKFLERKERYEKNFFNMAIADRIPRNMLKRYFKECGHDPTDHMINVSYTNVFKGCGSKADIVFMVDCSASLGNNNFKIQTQFVKEFVTSLHVGEANIRVGYVPYNTDVYQSFDLDMYDEVESVIQGIDHVRYNKGLTRTDRALIRMREMFKVAKKGVPRIALLITDGKSDACQETAAQAAEARKLDKIQVLVVGVGKNTDIEELFAIGGTRGNVFIVPDYFSLWKVKAAIMKRCKLANCEYCHWVAPTDLQVDTTRGLCKEEALEIIWQMFPPRGAGVVRTPREPHFIDTEDELNYRKRTLRLIEEKEAFYSTSLSFAIKSKLDKNDFTPSGGAWGGESSWTDSVGAAQTYVTREKDKKKAEQEEREKREKKEREKAAKAGEARQKKKGGKKAAKD